MKTLQDYIYESIVNDEINEGKLWDAVKKWWNNLFNPSKKKYDKYASKMDYATLQNYKQYIKDTFSESNIRLQKINPSSLDKIVRPNGEEPNKLDNTGFWKFTDEKISSASNADLFIACVYEDDEIKDTAALIIFNITSNSDYAEIKKLQIVDYFNSEFPLNKLIKLLIKKYTELFNDKKGLYIKKETDKGLYEKLVNDCNFLKETINNVNIAQLDFKS